MRPHSKNHPLALIHPFTKIVPLLYSLSFIPKVCADWFHRFSVWAFKGLPSINNIFTCMPFFLVCFFHFHLTLFRGLAGACVNPRSIFSLFVLSLVCPITHSFLDGFQPNLFTTSLKYALPVILFSA